MTVERCVLLGDVVGSRDVTERGEFSDRLRDAIRTVNERFAASLTAPVQTIKGIDEVGGVLETPAAAYDVTRELYGGIYPEQMRVAAVHGEIDVNGESDDVTEMDGPAFHDADSRLGNLTESDLLFWVAVDDGTVDELASMVANATLTLRSGWTDRQHEVVRAYEERGTQTAAADALGVGQPAVSKALQRVNWSRVHRMEETVDRVLEGCGGAP